VRAARSRVEARRTVGRTTRASPVYLFLHIAKNGGITVSRYLRQSYGRQALHVRSKSGSKEDIWAGIVRARPDTRRLRAVHGHRVFYGLHAIVDREARYFTFLRDPVSRTVSLYNFGVDSGLVPRDATGEPVSFERFLEEPAASNGMLRFLYYAMETGHTPGYDLPDPTPHHVTVAKRFLDACWFLGFVEDFDRDLDHVARAVGPSVVHRHANRSVPYLGGELDPGLRREVLRINEYDTELYEYARELAPARR
jgi:hypothetical protein